MGCPYIEEEGVGRYWCPLKAGFVSDETFDKYCYHSLDYRDCPIWMHEENLDSSNGGSGAQRTSGDNCYLTTACTIAKNLPDNCHELEILRGFRDNYLLCLPHGADDVAEYSRIAPQIVWEINRYDDSSDRWNALYEKLIYPCVKMIEAGNYADAYKLYKSISLELKEKYFKAG